MVAVKHETFHDYFVSLFSSCGKFSLLLLLLLREVRGCRLPQAGALPSTMASYEH